MPCEFAASINPLRLAVVDTCLPWFSFLSTAWRAQALCLLLEKAVVAMYVLGAFLRDAVSSDRQFQYCCPTASCPRLCSVSAFTVFSASRADRLLCHLMQKNRRISSLLVFAFPSPVDSHTHTSILDGRRLDVVGWTSAVGVRAYAAGNKNIKPVWFSPIAFLRPYMPRGVLRQPYRTTNRFPRRSSVLNAGGGRTPLAGDASADPGGVGGQERHLQHVR